MTLEQVLDLMDHEVWVRVRPHKRGPTGEVILPDIVVWSADWIGGGGVSPSVPEELKGYLYWGADDLSVETYDDPEFRGGSRGRRTWCR